MARNGSGVYLPPQNSWNPAINGQQALPNDWMAILDDVTTALTQSISADGQTPITGVLNFQGNRISNVGAPTGSGDALRWEQMTKGLDIASATTITIPVEGMLFDVTGTTTITTINDRFPGRIAFLRFDDVVEIAHSTSLVLPSGVNAKTSAGDVLCVMNTASGVWEVVSWPRFVAANFPSVTEPTITWPLMTWADTGNMLLKQRNATDTDWVTICPLLVALAPEEDLGFAIVYPNGGSAGSPANITNNSRYVTASPFPGHYVMCRLEVFLNGAWRQMIGQNFVTSFTALETSGVGATATQLNDTIIVQTGSSARAYNASNIDAYNSNGTGSTFNWPLPARVLVWKLKGVM